MPAIWVARKQKEAILYAFLLSAGGSTFAERTIGTRATPGRSHEDPQFNRFGDLRGRARRVDPLAFDEERGPRSVVPRVRDQRRLLTRRRGSSRRDRAAAHQRAPRGCH